MIERLNIIVSDEILNLTAKIFTSKIVNYSTRFIYNPKIVISTPKKSIDILKLLFYYFNYIPKLSVKKSAQQLFGIPNTIALYLTSGKFDDNYPVIQVH